MKRGSVNLRVGLRLTRLRWAFLAIVSFISVALVADRIFPPPLSRADDLGALILDRNGRQLHAFANTEGRWRFTAELDAIDPAFVERLILIEDRRFWRHSGVDALAMARAITTAVTAGEVKSGGSTITMQTARLLEPRKRTVFAKLIEMLRALQIEARLSKSEILSLYLTLAPYGGNIEGVRAASLIYFGKEPARLSTDQQALLIALPQAPEARRPDRQHEAAKAARARILQRLVGLGSLTASQAAEAASVAAPGARHAFPQRAYHAARALRQDAVHASMDLRASIELSAQIAAESILERFAAERPGLNAAAIVVDNRTREVLASVGSASFAGPGGWMDLTRASRSPGSLLKPLIYGLAFDDGVAGPDTLIRDAPTDFGAYRPENFDRVFHGEVRLREALQHSLNVPAVQALERVGPGRLAAALGEAGAAVRLPAKAMGKPTLALALGAGGLSLRDVALVYAALANDGIIQPLIWEMEDEPGAEDGEDRLRIMSAVSARQIGAILRTAPSIDGRAPAELSAAAPRVAFKTGTSYGFRDAWAAGWDDAYTIAVWTGQADGASTPGLTGRSAAAPLLFEMFDRISDAAPGALAMRPLDGADFGGMGPAALNRAVPDAPPFEIAFPPSGAELFLPAGRADRGFVPAARGGAGDVRWYVDGAPLPASRDPRRTPWRPDEDGFYTIVAVDGDGRVSTTHVRVRGGA